MKAGVAYRITTQELPPPTHSYEFLLAENGIFIRGVKPGLQVQFPLAICSIRGLFPLKSYLQLEAPRVPRPLVEELVTVAMGQETEILFYLSWEQECNHWQLTIPDQNQGTADVTPNDTASDQYRRALIECHSHGGYPAFFSQQDNQDEEGFRIYAVLGNLLHRPTLRTRIGLFGHFWEVPSTSIFELPPGILSPEYGGDK